MRGYIGLDIGGTKILGALFDEDGNIIKKVKKKTKAEQGGDYVISRIKRVVDIILDEDEVNLLGIGAGYPGVIEDESVIRFTPNIPLYDCDLGKIMQESYGTPFVLGNDVNAAMYGEWRSGNHAKAKDAIGIFVGTGIGGAIISNGKLYLGSGAAGEIGHMIVKEGGSYCGCGTRGCLEAYASKTAMQNYIRAAMHKGIKSSLADSFESLDEGGMLKSSALKEAYDANDQLMHDMISEVNHYLAVGCASLINIFHPQVLIFGGGIIEELGHVMLPAIKAEASTLTLGGMMGDIEFEKASLGDDAGIVGAYHLIRDKIQA